MADWNSAPNREKGSGLLGERVRIPCSGCSKIARSQPGREDGGFREATSQKARSNLQKLQTLVGILLFLSAGVGIFLLATDRSLWLLAVSHAVGLIIIVMIDVILGFLSFVEWKRAYLPSIAAALLGFVLQLGDIFTAPQYGLTIGYFANYLFGLWAFDLLLLLQVAIMLVGVVGRPYAVSLARRKTRRGRELDLTRRSFLKSLAGLASAIGIGVLVSSIKLPAGTNSTSQSTTTTAQTGTAAGSIANVNNLKANTPLQFEYPAGYPNVLVKKADGTLTALSLLCTHVCCVCSYDAASNMVYCPCHGSVFDSNGNVIQGPASSPLPKVELRVDAAGNVFPTGISNPGPCHV
jgi:cytochrome b6-f complex iron-sulfur subunit